MFGVSGLDDNDVFEFEIHDKTVHWNKTELLNQLKRSESASQLSREAKAELEKVQNEKAIIESDKAKLAQQASLANISPEIAKARSVELELGEQFNKALEEESMDLPVIQAKLQKAQQHRQVLEGAHQQHATQLREAHINQQKQILSSNGFGHVIEKGLESPTMKFMQETLAPEAFNIACLLYTSPSPRDS